MKQLHVLGWLRMLLTATIGISFGQWQESFVAGLFAFAASTLLSNLLANLEPQ